jgi:hypothetical protein
MNTKDEIEKIKRAIEEMQKAQDDLSKTMNRVYKVTLPAAVYTKVLWVTTNPQLFKTNYWN